MPEMVRHGETGWIVPPGDAALLAEQLETLLDDEELRVRTGCQARQWAQQSRSLDGMAAGTLNVYRQAIEMQGGRKGAAARSYFGEEQRTGRIPGAFHPSDLLNEMYPGITLAEIMRAKLPPAYSIPDARTALALLK
jgi:hypothetical protein